jgi:hypothetical protein
MARRGFRFGRMSLALAAAAMSVAAVLANASRADEVDRRIAQARATEAVIWGMPAVNALLMYDQMVKVGGKPGEIIYWGKPLDWRNQTLTPNPDTLYFMGFYDTRASGPMVVEIPPAGEDGSLNGNFVTLWQTALEDAGLLGVDKGSGAKLLITPPGFAAEVPEGFRQLASDTYTGYFLARSTLQNRDEAGIEKSVAYGKRIRFYPLSRLQNQPQTVFRDVGDMEFDATIKYDASYFTLLDRVVQSEPWIARDRAMIDQLRTIGIEKGKAFAPDAAARAVLETGAADARAWLKARYDAGFPAFFEGTNWTMPALPDALDGQATAYSNPDRYAVDARGLAYTYAYIAIKHLGAGQFYVINIRDKLGRNYDGGQTYRLHVPPDVPVKQYWSVTVYDRETHALVKGMERASRASNAAELEKNEDGSVDIFFGPQSPEGREANWVPTDPAREFELMFRFYGPMQGLFDNQWSLPDVERM